MMEVDPVSSHAAPRLPMPLRPLPPDEAPPDRPSPPPVDDDEDDGLDYEVEEVDPAVLAHQQEQARQQLDQAKRAIDVDAVYRELERRDDFDLEGFELRFGVRSLLALTAGVAVLLGLWKVGAFNGHTFAALVCLSLIGLTAAHAWLGRRERLRQAEVVAFRRRQLREARRASGIVDDEDDDEADEPAPSAGGDGMLSVLRSPKFSLGEMMLAATAATVVVALLAFAGSFTGAAAALGMLALIGFALQAADVDVPRPAVLAWWLALTGYCVLTLVTAVTGAAGP